MDDAFLAPRNADEKSIRDAILVYREAQSTKLQQEMFGQAKRLADAERRLRSKPTKAAAESRRIARNKIEHAKAQLGELLGAEHLDREVNYPAPSQPNARSGMQACTTAPHRTLRWIATGSDDRCGIRTIRMRHASWSAFPASSM